MCVADTNQLAEDDGFEGKLKESEEFIHPIMMKEEKPRDKEQIEKAVQETSDWLDKNQLDEKGEFVGKQKELDRMVQEAEKYRAENELHRSTIEAKTGLENYCFTLRNTLQEEQHKDKFEDQDNEKLEIAVQETLDWLDKNQLAEKDEFEDKQKELEGVANPIMVRLRDDQVHSWNDHGKADCFAALSRMAELTKQARELEKKKNADLQEFPFRSLSDG